MQTYLLETTVIYKSGESDRIYRFCLIHLPQVAHNFIFRTQQDILSPEPRVYFFGSTLAVSQSLYRVPVRD